VHSNARLESKYCELAGIGGSALSLAGLAEFRKFSPFFAVFVHSHAEVSDGLSFRLSVRLEAVRIAGEIGNNGGARQRRGARFAALRVRPRRKARDVVRIAA
jgi:hypothetical protein